MMTRSGKKSLSFKEKCRMVRNNKDIVDDINEYLRANEKLIDSEYRKIVNKSLDKKSRDYEFVVASIYQEYIDYYSQISVIIYTLNNPNDPNNSKNKVIKFKEIFRTLEQMDKLIERFEEAKRIFYMNR